MEKRIQLEKRGRPDDQITELILDNCRSTNVEGLSDSFTALEVLSMINVGLTSLKSFPKLPSLRKLELSDNRISNGLSHLTGSPKLTNLNLSGNRIKDFDELKALKDLQNLEVLDLFNNEVTAVHSYRDKLFELIPSLKYLDGYDKDDNEADDDDEEGAEDEEDDDAESDTSGSLSLSDVYKDNVEDDGSEWSGEDAGGDEEELNDLSEDDEEDEEAGSSNGEEERGKKRKHDEGSNDG